MGSYLLDCSAVIKLYVDEPGLACSRLRNLPPREDGYTLHVADYTFVEMLGVLKGKKMRQRTLTNAQYAAAIASLTGDLVQGRLKWHTVELDLEAVTRALLDSETYATDLIDCYHFQAMRTIPGMRTAILTSCDRDLIEIAKKKRVHYWNPEDSAVPTFTATLASLEEL